MKQTLRVKECFEQRFNIHFVSNNIIGRYNKELFHTTSRLHAALAQREVGLGLGCGRDDLGDALDHCAHTVGLPRLVRALVLDGEDRRVLLLRQLLEVRAVQRSDRRVEGCWGGGGRRRHEGRYT